MYPGWVRSLRDRCQRSGVAYYFKQWGEWGPSLGRSQSQCLVWPDGTYREFSHTPGSFDTGIPLMPPGWCNSERVGKKAAGRELDGRTWDQYPETVTA
jgi:protein gp37